MATHFLETIRSLSVLVQDQKLEIQRLSEELHRSAIEQEKLKQQLVQKQGKTIINATKTSNSNRQNGSVSWSESTQGTWDWHGRKIFVNVPLQRKTIFQLRNERIKMTQPVAEKNQQEQKEQQKQQEQKEQKEQKDINIIQTAITATPIPRTTTSENKNNKNWMTDHFFKLQPVIKSTEEETFEDEPEEEKEKKGLEEAKYDVDPSQEDLLDSLDISGDFFGGDMDTPAPMRTVVNGAWDTIQSGGPLNSANPQFSVSFPDAGLHRVEIVVSREKPSRKAGIIFYVFDAGLPGAKEMRGNSGNNSDHYGRMWFGYPDDAADELRLSPKYKSKATRGRRTKLKATFRGSGRSYIIVPCMENMGTTGDFQLSVLGGSTSRSKDDMDSQPPTVTKLPDLKYYETKLGKWNGISASRLQLFANSSDPSMSAPHVCNPQFLMTAQSAENSDSNNNRFVLVTVTCSKKIAKNSTLHIYVYEAPSKKTSNNPHRRRLTFPSSALVASQDGILSGSSVTVSANIGTSRGKFVVCCCIQEEEQERNENDDYEYDTPLREGDFELHVKAEDENSIKISEQLPLPDAFNDRDETNEIIDCESMLNKMRNSRLPSAGSGSGIDQLDWDFLTLESDPLPKILKKFKSGTKFVDQTFQPIDSSVNKDPHDTQLHYERWARLSNICDEHCLFRDGIDADDVLQGSLGNCWFMGAIASIAWARPECIRSLFSPACTRKQCFEAGCFSLKILDLKTQTWRWVVVDDYIPVDKNFRPVFSRGRDPNEIWVMLIEKCFAKLHGSYQSVSVIFIIVVVDFIIAFADVRCFSSFLFVQMEDGWSFPILYENWSGYKMFNTCSC
jgi:hypothetical protein